MRALLAGLAAFLAFFASAVPLSAEITHPYTIDEKAQVNFGDATTVAGHTGLENYTHEYVGGYLHLSFTYTHHTCCFSSYPPLLYLTDVDPTATSTPTERAADVIYQIFAGDATDWYFYDIQFDATGYTKSVKEAGLVEIDNEHVTVTGQTDSDWVALANNYPVAPATGFSMSFAPLLIHEASALASQYVAARVARRPNDRLRCVETTQGWYCPDEETRQYSIMLLLEQITAFLRKLVELVREQSVAAASLLSL